MSIKFSGLMLFAVLSQFNPYTYAAEECFDWTEKEDSAPVWLNPELSKFIQIKKDKNELGDAQLKSLINTLAEERAKKFCALRDQTLTQCTPMNNYTLERFLEEISKTQFGGFFSNGDSKNYSFKRLCCATDPSEAARQKDCFPEKKYLAVQGDADEMARVVEQVLTMQGTLSKFDKTPDHCEQPTESAIPHVPAEASAAPLEADDDKQDFFTLAIQEGICTADMVGSSLCRDLKNANLLDPQSYNYLNWLGRAGLYTSASLVQLFDKYKNRKTEHGQGSRSETLTQLVSEIENDINRKNSPYTKDQIATMRSLIRETKDALFAYSSKKTESFRDRVYAELTKLQSGKEKDSPQGKDSDGKSSSMISRFAKGVQSTLKHNSGANLSWNQLAEIYQSMNPTIESLETEHLGPVKEKFEKLIKFSELPKQIKRLDAHAESNCRDKLNRKGDAKAKLIQIAGGVVALANTKTKNLKNQGRQLHYVYGDPGNGKTTGIEEIAECLDVPICKLTITEFQNRDKSIPPANFLRNYIVSCIKDQNRFQDSHGQKYVNGIVLLDDITELLKTELFVEPKGSDNTYSSSKKTEAEVQNELIREGLRKDFFLALKDLGDPAVENLIDPETGLPINISRLMITSTGNFLPPEFKDTSSNLLSRLSSYEMPYPDREDRTNYVYDHYNKYKDDLKKSKGFAYVQNHFSKCDEKLKELLNFDIDKANSMQGRMGMRGLTKLFPDFMNTVRQGVNNGSPDRECSGFSVVKRARDIKDYDRVQTPELLIEDFDNRVKSFDLEANSKEWKNIKNQEILNYKDQVYRQALSDLPLGMKKAKFEILRKMAQFETGTRPPEAKELGQSLKRRFSHLIEGKEKNMDRYTQISKIANHINNRVQEGLRVNAAHTDNKMILVNPMDEYGDLTPVRTLAGEFKSPYCEINNFSEATADKAKDWHKYRFNDEAAPYLDVNVNGETITFRLDRERRIYSFEGQTMFSNYKSKYYLLDPKTRKPVEYDRSQIEEETDPVEKLISYCLERWKNAENQSRGFILLNDPEFSKQMDNKFIQQVNQRINSAEHLFGTDQAMRNLKRLNFFVVGKSSVNDLNHDDFLLMNVDRLSAAGRRAVAERILHEELEKVKNQFGSEVSLNDYEKRSFDYLLAFDKRMFKRLNGSVTLSSLERSVRDLVNRSVRSRLDDGLGMSISVPEFTEGATKKTFEGIYGQALPEKPKDKGKGKEIKKERQSN